MPALAEQSQPLTVSGEVKLISNGKFQAQVAMARGLTMNMGKSAVLSVGPVDIAIISRHIEPYDPECFRSLDGDIPSYDRHLAMFFALQLEVLVQAGLYQTENRSASQRRGSCLTALWLALNFHDVCHNYLAYSTQAHSIAPYLPLPAAGSA